jgi:DNA-binding LacI/PurR family transcriptional regulator
MKMKTDRPPTMNDVAKASGVTQATVSYVLNNSGDISEPVKQRVKEAAEQLGYIRNSVARNLKLRTANTIGIIVPDVTNSYYSEIIKYTEKIIRESGYFAFICITTHNPQIEDWYTTSLIEQKVAGVVVCYGLSNADVLRKFLTYNVPFVVLDDDAQGNNIDAACVLVNNIKGSFLAVQQFVSLGISKIAFCSETTYNLALRDRYMGFVLAIKAFSLESQLQHVYIAGEEVDQNDKIMLGYHAAEEIFAKSNPEGIFAVNDEMAIGVMKKVNEMGLRIPQDVAIIGYDNVPLSSVITPALTTINQPLKTMCIQGTNILRDLMHGEDHLKHRIMLEPSIIVRETAPHQRDW